MASVIPMQVPVDVQVQANPKSGFRTTEFWSTLFVHLLTVASMVSVLSGHTFSSTALTPLVPAAAAVASGIAQAYYSHSRSQLKQALVGLAASVANAASQDVPAAPVPPASAAVPPSP